MPGPTVLIIDDEESIRKTLAGVLADEGYEITTAASGQEGLDLLQEAQPAIVMLDISMEPGIDGIETLRRIKELDIELGDCRVRGPGSRVQGVKSHAVIARSGATRQSRFIDQLRTARLLRFAR